MNKNYLDINRNSWNNRVDAHLQSEFYDVPSFKSGKNSLNEIELKLLGDVKGKSLLHLQCHFGQDTLSLARLGAKALGVDLSDKAVAAATMLNSELGLDARFICCDVYDLPNQLNEQFDVVFTSYGTIGWLPDLDKWAYVVKNHLRKGGKFVMAEFHPVVWMFDDNFEKIAYPYLNRGVIVENETGTYADREASINQDYMMWNHGLSEVIGSLLKQGLQLESFEEFDYSPYNCFLKTVEKEPGKFFIEHLEAKIPMVYALEMTRDK
jgi:SAM-dependent methyltransferase